MTQALDISFGAQFVTPQWCKDRIADGWELLIVNLWAGATDMPYAERALRYWREAGGRTQAYFAINGSRQPLGHFNKAFLAAGEEWPYLERVWVDCEIDGVLVDQVRGALELVKATQKPTGIYTAYWFWTEHMGNTDDFADYPLWNAFYDGDPDIDFSRYLYGGWSMDKLYLEQYQGTTDISGVECDLNIILHEEDEMDLNTIIHRLNVMWGHSDRLEQAGREIKESIIEIKRALGIN